MIKRSIKILLERAGWGMHRVPRPRARTKMHNPPQDRIHYACGYTYHPGWLNVDIIDKGPENYLYVNLVDRHPFPDNHFKFALCEDFLEHVSQADSLVFLVEVFRTLKPGGILRLTFPGFENVLENHFIKPTFDIYAAGRLEAYSKLGHVHFYSRDSLILAARSIGFEVEFVRPNISKYPELSDITGRSESVHLHAELKKPLGF